MAGLTGKRIIVAGGATGIGAASAERLAEQGARVLIGDLNAGRAEQTVRRIVEAGGTAIATRFDLADEASIRATHEMALAEFGAVDGLFNVGADLRGVGDLARVQRLEQARTAPRSPFEAAYGSFDAFAAETQAGIDASQFDSREMRSSSTASAVGMMTGFGGCGAVTGYGKWRGDGRAYPGMARGMARTRPSAARTAREAPRQGGSGETAMVSALAEAVRAH